MDGTLVNVCGAATQGDPGQHREHGRTASRNASHFRVYEPLSGLLGPVQIEILPRKTGPIGVPGGL